METIKEVKVRIHKGVKPYGGRIFPARLVELTSGHREYLVNVSARASAEGWVSIVHKDERIYKVHEVDEV